MNSCKYAICWNTYFCLLINIGSVLEQVNPVMVYGHCNQVFFDYEISLLIIKTSVLFFYTKILNFIVFILDYAFVSVKVYAFIFKFHLYVYCNNKGVTR